MNSLHLDSWLKNIKISFFTKPETPLTTYETNQKAGNSIYAIRLYKTGNSGEKVEEKNSTSQMSFFRLIDHKHLTTRDLSLKAKI